MRCILHFIRIQNTSHCLTHSNCRETKAMRCILNSYKVQSSQKINMEKCEISFSNKLEG